MTCGAVTPAAAPAAGITQAKGFPVKNGDIEKHEVTVRTVHLPYQQCLSFLTCKIEHHGHFCMCDEHLKCLRAQMWRCCSNKRKEDRDIKTRT